MASRPSLRSFLATARDALQSAANKPAKLSFVVGNEAADLDSLCSAILLAYVRSHQSPQLAPSLHVPVANIPRPDFSLRPEFAGALQRVGLTTDDVPSLDDVPASLRDGHAELTRWVLVDHNALTGPLREPFAPRVVGCIDHHVDEGAVPENPEDEPRIIDVAGSCATLVVQYARQAWDRAVRDHGPAEVDAQLARLALAPVLNDTANLHSPHKTTPLDIDVVLHLEAKLRGAGTEAGVGYDRNAYYDELHRLEGDLSGMTARDILRKDYKEWEESGCRLGIAAAPRPLEYIAERAGDTQSLLDVLADWGREKDLDVNVLMTRFVRDGELRKAILVWGVGERGVRVAKEFERRFGEGLRLQPWGAGEFDGEEDGCRWRRGWRMEDTSQSRKQVAPLLREVVRAVLE